MGVFTCIALFAGSESESGRAFAAAQAMAAGPGSRGHCYGVDSETLVCTELLVSEPPRRLSDAAAAQ
jgi:hypothetical protein